MMKMIKEREKNPNRSQTIIDKNNNSHCHSKKISKRNRRKMKRTRIRFQALNNLDNLKNFSKGPILRGLIATRRMMVSSLTILQNEIMPSD